MAVRDGPSVAYKTDYVPDNHRPMNESKADLTPIRANRQTARYRGSHNPPYENGRPEAQWRETGAKEEAQEQGQLGMVYPELLDRSSRVSLSKVVKGTVFLRNSTTAAGSTLEGSEGVGILLTPLWCLVPVLSESQDGLIFMRMIGACPVSGMSPLTSRARGRVRRHTRAR